MLTLTSPTSSAASDISSALAGGGLSALLQVQVISRNATGDSNPLLMATANTSSPIYLPNTYPNGSFVPLGDLDYNGYPAVSNTGSLLLYSVLLHTLSEEEIELSKAS
jgi:hypothetical protein